MKNHAVLKIVFVFLLQFFLVNAVLITRVRMFPTVEAPFIFDLIFAVATGMILFLSACFIMNQINRISFIYDLLVMAGQYIFDLAFLFVILVAFFPR